MGASFVGSPTQIADTLEEWVNEADVDGFNIAYALSPGTFQDFIKFVVPVLQNRGLVPETYEGNTFRNNLFGNGDQLPENHPGKSQKVLANR